MPAEAATKAGCPRLRALISFLLSTGRSCFQQGEALHRSLDRGGVLLQFLAPDFRSSVKPRLTVSATTYAYARQEVVHELWPYHSLCEALHETRHD